MKFFSLLLNRIFRLDPKLVEASEKTDRIAATVNGDMNWMLTCKPKVAYEIECDDGNIYKKED